MATLELTEAEVGTLRTLLEETVSDLRMEIADTDQKEFRESLKEKKQVLLDLMERLG